MSETTLESEAQTLVEFGRKGQLAIMTGAGLSMAAPSALPSWWRLNIDAYIACAGNDKKLREQVAHIAERQVPPAVLAYYFRRTMGPDRYFDLFAPLRAAEPNINHDCLAVLRANNIVRHLITLNFDLLQERALRRIGVDPVVLTDGERLDVNSETVSLFKPHGSLDDPPSMMGTLDEVTRDGGIGETAKDKIGEIRSKCHLLVLGYSGGDLFVDPDYLGFISRKADTNIYWTFLPGQASCALDRLKAQTPSLLIRHGRMPDCLLHICNAAGLSTAPANAVAKSNDSAARGELGPPSEKAGFMFADLFSHIGDNARQRACIRSEAFRAIEKLDVVAGAQSLVALAQWHADHGHFDLSVLMINPLLEMSTLPKWTSLQPEAFAVASSLAKRLPPDSIFHERLRALAPPVRTSQSDPYELSRAGLEKYNQDQYADAIKLLNKALESGALDDVFLKAEVIGNLGLAEIRVGRIEAGRRHLQQALELHEALEQPELVKKDLLNLATLCAEQNAPQEAIAYLERLGAMKIEEGHWQVHQRGFELLGELHEAAKRTREAINAYERGAEIAESSRTVHGPLIAKNLRRKARQLGRPCAR